MIVSKAEMVAFVFWAYDSFKILAEQSEAIIFCPGQLTWLSVSLDSSVPEPQGSQKDPEDSLVLESSGDTQESLKIT